MRLSLSVLLVTLALCCYEANANVCPAMVTNIRTFYLDPNYLHEDLLKTLNVPEPLVEAKLAVKTCVDNVSYGKKLKVALAMEKMFQACNQ
ncbi:secretoglobin family 1D member 2-like [Molossus nigricans]